ncbi:actin-like ATPase domain-containing protein [Aulographum hederae CBS 113979]|uniref:Actin-like ATPase domain-containing protein n=1 Tax=Aulographum hederae CBS 113979 TaxID=1176131 RepID=A0A6G1GR24_9PEZI|nr:actin-like ATPase domain-containing protein [Aulographum hederae CBS 113979]
MASTPDYFNRKISVGRTRPPPSQLQISGAAASPRTPLFTRSTSSQLYNSPSATYRTDEEFIVLEVGTRFLRAGLAAESSPRCVLNFGPDQQRRVGDYRQWMPGHENKRRKRKRGESWGQNHELWRMDIRDQDTALVEDKLDRALREADQKYLLTDNRPKRITLVVDSLLPRPLLSILLSNCFHAFAAHTITLLPTSIASTVSSGLRSALVVDIGWAETSVTAVYEYKEIAQKRSTRAAKWLGEETATLLAVESAKASGKEKADSTDEPSVEETEEFVTRLCWCQDYATAHTAPDESKEIAEEDFEDISVSVPLPGASQTLSIPFSSLSKPVESTFFPQPLITPSRDPPASADDDELPLPLLLYKTLLSLPVEVRSTLLLRIILTGGGSHVPGLSSRLLSELHALIQNREWDIVRNWGSAAEVMAQKAAQARERKAAAEKNAERDAAAGSTGRSAEAESGGMTMPPTIVELERQLERPGSKSRPVTPGTLRAVESMGPWVGGSIFANLKIKGVVEVDRERFLSQGLASAGKEAGFAGHAGAEKVPLAGTRASLGGKMEGKTVWTLGIWGE